jgi:D-sedoheptulose 7-phosphate isomerase
MFTSYVKQVIDCAMNINQKDIDKVVMLLDEISTTRAGVYILGNGGSAAIASHFAIDLQKSGHARGKSIRAISLVDNVSVLTAVSNDIGYQEVFSWQINELCDSKDLLITISSSGNSSNIIHALSAASSKGMKTISISGFEGGKASKLANVSLVAKSEPGEYGLVEDSHSMLCHYISSLLRLK